MQGLKSAILTIFQNGLGWLCPASAASRIPHRNSEILFVLGRGYSKFESSPESVEPIFCLSEMCFENSVSNRKNNEANTSDQNEKCETSGTCYSKHSEHTFQPKMNLENLETNSAPAHQFHQTSKKMAEKVKKLPPGYVNVSTKDPAFPTRTNSYDENKKESSSDGDSSDDEDDEPKESVKEEKDGPPLKMSKTEEV